MPNWCSNEVVLYHEDKALIQKALDAFKVGALCQALRPQPPELNDVPTGVRSSDPQEEQDAVKKRRSEMIKKYGAPDWYDWRVKHWGTKWDVGGSDCEYEWIGESSNVIHLRFDSAWSPPVPFYDYLSDELGFKVRAYYREEGMGFHGQYHEETGDKCEDIVSMPDIDDILEIEMEKGVKVQ